MFVVSLSCDKTIVARMLRTRPVNSDVFTLIFKGLIEFGYTQQQRSGRMVRERSRSRSKRSGDAGFVRVFPNVAKQPTAAQQLPSSARFRNTGRSRASRQNGGLATTTKRQNE